MILRGLVFPLSIPLWACTTDPARIPVATQLALHFSGMSGRVGVMVVGAQLRVTGETRDPQGSCSRYRFVFCRQRLSSLRLLRTEQCREER